MTKEIAKRPLPPLIAYRQYFYNFISCTLLYKFGYAIALSSLYLLFVGKSIFYLKKVSYSNNEKVEKSRRDLKQISSHTQCPLSHAL